MEENCRHQEERRTCLRDGASPTDDSIREGRRRKVETGNKEEDRGTGKNE